jgi:hypothetical protein
MEKEEEEHLFFEALDNLKNPSWFETCFFGNRKILNSEIPGRIALFLLAIQDEPDFFLEFLKKTRVVRIPGSWILEVAVHGHWKTFQVLLNYQVWSPEEIGTILCSSWSLHPEILQSLLSYRYLIWTPYLIVLVFVQGNLENQVKILEDAGFQNCYKKIQGSLYRFLENQVYCLAGNQGLQNQKSLFRKYEIADENLEFLMRSKL